MSIEETLKTLGIRLPRPAATAGAYAPAITAGKLVFVSGQLPWWDGQLAFGGKLGHDLTVDQGHEAAMVCAVNTLAVLKQHLGTLDHLHQVVRLDVFVNSAAGFTEQSKVANGASEFLQEVFGNFGKHARVAVGVSELPMDAAVEIATTVAIR